MDKNPDFEANYFAEFEKFAKMKFDVDMGPLRNAVADVERSVRHLPLVAAITGGIVAGAGFLLLNHKKDKSNRQWVDRVTNENSQEASVRR